METTVKHLPIFDFQGPELVRSINILGHLCNINPFTYIGTDEKEFYLNTCIRNALSKEENPQIAYFVNLVMWHTMTSEEKEFYSKKRKEVKSKIDLAKKFIGNEMQPEETIFTKTCCYVSLDDDLTGLRTKIHKLSANTLSKLYYIANLYRASYLIKDIQLFLIDKGNKEKPLYNIKEYMYIRNKFAIILKRNAKTEGSNINIKAIKDLPLTKEEQEEKQFVINCLNGINQLLVAFDKNPSQLIQEYIKWYNPLKYEKYIEISQVLINGNKVHSIKDLEKKFNSI